MLIPQIDASALLVGSPTFIPSASLDKPPRLSLDMSGVLAGFFGGDDAMSAMAMVHVYEDRRWLGWYNTPGSLQIAKRFRSFARFAPSHNNTLPKPLPQKVDTDPMALFGLDSCKGPKFRAAHSGTVIQQTSYLATLFMKECAAWQSEGRVVHGRKTQPVGITIADLGHIPTSEMHPTYTSASTLFFASIPIAASVGTCMLCAVCGDWYAFSLILVGIIASGISSLVLGSADFVFTHPEPAKGSPAGDGILTLDKDIVLLKGTESAVNSITRGRFSLRFSSEFHYHLVRWCSVLFLVQCISQLLLIPQASLFGQMMFLVSLGVSALYNARLSSLGGEKMSRKLLFSRVLESPGLTKYTLGTWTAAAVFILLVLRPQDPTKLLDELLPNDTKVWKRWKATVSEQLRRPNDYTFLSESKVGRADGFTDQEGELLELLYGDARAAYDGYMDYLRSDAF